MSVQSPDTVHWVPSFAHTPGFACGRDGYHGEDHEDMLPTQFPMDYDAVRGRGSEAYVSPLTVPTKRKRASVSNPDDGLSTVSRRRTRKTQSRTTGGRGQSSCHTPAPSTRAWPRRMVVDAVEIVRRGPVRTVEPGSATRRTGSPRKIASSYYPSPPTSARAAHPGTVERNESPSPGSTLRLKTSKYFVRASDSIAENVPILTPPNSPMLTIPVSPYPLDRPFQDTADELRHFPTWCNSPELFDDLMIMLRRLKPILVQESVRDDPWKVLIAVRLLNVTTGKAAIPVFCKIISRWQTAQDLVHAPQDELVELLRPLGLYNKRARWLKDMSERFLEDRQALAPLLSGEHVALPHSHYPGIGPYALDSLRIFCARDEDAWKHVMPRDKELVRYLRWRWAVEQGKTWCPGGIGVIGDVNVPYLITLVDELAAHYDATIGGEGYMYHFGNDVCGVSMGGESRGHSSIKH